MRRLIDALASLFGGTLALAVIALLILAGPAIFIFVVNHLASAGGSDFHIAHGLLNYLAALVLLSVIGAFCGGRGKR